MACHNTRMPNTMTSSPRHRISRPAHSIANRRALRVQCTTSWPRLNPSPHLSVTDTWLLPRRYPHGHREGRGQTDNHNFATTTHLRLCHSSSTKERSCCSPTTPTWELSTASGTKALAVIDACTNGPATHFLCGQPTGYGSVSSAVAAKADILPDRRPNAVVFRSAHHG